MILHPDITYENSNIKRSAITKTIGRFNKIKEEVKNLHGGKYSYDNFIYQGMKYKSYITCPIHGDFMQSLDQHRLYGCRLCADESNRKYITKEYLIEQATKAHGDKYLYTEIKEEKIRASSFINIVCPKHGVFKSTFYGLTVIKTGCLGCAREHCDIDVRKRFFDRPTVLYYVKIKYNNKEYYKIGITCRFNEFDVSPRFASEPVTTETIYMEYYLNGKHAYEKEQELHKKYKMYRIPYDMVILNSGGNSEIYTVDCWDIKNKGFI